jgi:hypothetical protein
VSTSSRRGELTALIGLLATAALVSLGHQSASAQEPQVDNCVACHGALDDERLAGPVDAFASDVHAERGFGCIACHGGDATIAGFEGMDPAKGFVGRPRGRMLLDVCGRCHADAGFMRQYNPSLRVDQIAEYVTSVHGQRLVQLGDTLVATCASCHPAHNVRPPSDPNSSVHPLNVAGLCGSCHGDAAYMAPYGIPTDQPARYEGSVHRRQLVEAGDLSAPTCNDCHGNHGAAPPGLSWVGNVCGQCHATMGELFRESQHAELFAMLGVPGCATCHGNHEILDATTEFLGATEGTACAQCHSPEDAGGAVAQQMRALIDSLDAQLDSAQHLLERAENRGMEVSQAMFELEAANNARIGARAAVHGFDLEAVESEVAEGLVVTGAGLLAGEEALAEWDFRRIGLAVSIVIIVGLISGLVLKIREMDRRA